MDFVKDLLLKLRYSVILLIAGIFLILLSQYKLSGAWNALKVDGRPSTSMVYLLTGLGLTVASLLLNVIDYEDIALWKGCHLEKTSSGFKSIYKDSELYIEFGSLQELYSPSDTSVVVLPANEFFDDRCFRDLHTAAGAFVRSHFDVAQTVGLKALVDQKLENCPFEHVSRRNQQTSTIEVLKSYGTGMCVYLEHPFGTTHRVILAAVATDREDTGLRTEMASIFQVMSGVHRIIARERAISIIYIPLLGAGKGGVPAQLALRALTIAALEARCAEGGHAMKEIHLVVYQPAGKEPQVSVKLAKRAIRELVGLYQEVSR